jgi:hypothetical protein
MLKTYIRMLIDGTIIVVLAAAGMFILFLMRVAHVL